MKGKVLFLAFFLAANLTTGLFAQSPITIDHTPFYEYVPDPVNSYEIRATITSTAGTINVKRVWYNVNGGAWVQLFMQPTNAPDEYVAYIPPQLRGTKIIYYVRAADTAGNILNHPPEAPGSGLTGHLFRIGHFAPLYSYDFESGDSGWMSGTTQGEDDWMVGPPNVGGQNPNDPLTAYSGFSVWGNDLTGASNQQGNYPDMTNNFLESPPLDFTSHSSIWLQYRRWLTIEEGIYDTGRILVNGTEVWVNKSNGHHLDTEWVPHDVLLSPHADNQANVILRFELNSDQALNFGGWNLDDVKAVKKIAQEAFTAIDDPTPSPDQMVTVTIQADPNAPWYLVAAKRQGQGFFQVPNGGPLVWTGLHERSMIHYKTGQTDGSGNFTLTRRVPNRTDIIGKTRRFTVIAPAGGHYVAAPTVRVDFVP